MRMPRRTFLSRLATVAGATLATTVVAAVWAQQPPAPKLTLTGHGDAVLGVALNNDGKFLASASADKSVKIWDLAQGKEAKALAHPDQVIKVVYSPNGALLATVSADRTLRIWNPADGKDAG